VPVTLSATPVNSVSSAVTIDPQGGKGPFLGQIVTLCHVLPICLRSQIFCTFICFLQHYYSFCLYSCHEYLQLAMTSSIKNSSRLSAGSLHNTTRKESQGGFRFVSMSLSALRCHPSSFEVGLKCGGFVLLHIGRHEL
jgi:hypothetical protein